jgi:hypothetical protein
MHCRTTQGHCIYHCLQQSTWHRHPSDVHKQTLNTAECTGALHLLLPAAEHQQTGLQIVKGIAALCKAAIKGRHCI